MHSIRETCGTDDAAHAVKLVAGYFRHYALVDRLTAIE